jgi:hypothetical protein
LEFFDNNGRDTAWLTDGPDEQATAKVDIAMTDNELLKRCIPLKRLNTTMVALPLNLLNTNSHLARPKTAKNI